METLSFFDAELFRWIVIPVLIFFARVVDVSLGTLRIIYISRGMKVLAPLFGFCEILIWLVAIGQIMQNLTSISYYLAYAFGFASGNFVGIFIEERLAVGKVVLRIITQRDATELIRELRAKGYGVTVVDAWGSTGPVKLIFTVISRKDVEDAVALVQHLNPRAFFSVEDVRLASDGIFPPHRISTLQRLRFTRKGK